MTASLYARINALTAELRTLRQDNERLRQHNQELIAQAHERRSVELPNPFDLFTTPRTPGCPRYLSELSAACLEAAQLIDAQHVPQTGRMMFDPESGELLAGAK